MHVDAHMIVDQLSPSAVHELCHRLVTAIASPLQPMERLTDYYARVYLAQRELVQTALDERAASGRREMAVSAEYVDFDARR